MFEVDVKFVMEEHEEEEEEEEQEHEDRPFYLFRIYCIMYLLAVLISLLK